MAKTNVLAVATPTLGQVHMLWTMAIMDLQWPLNCTRTMIPCFDVVGNEIAEARNRLVKMCLDFETESRTMSHLFWVDDDVLVPRAALLKLISHNRPVASGVYFTKTEIGEPLIFPSAGNGTTPFVPDQEIEVYGWSHGLCLIQMDVYRRCLAELPMKLDKYGNPEFYRTPTMEDATFRDGVLGVGGTEDFPFFEKCRALGIKPLVDTCKHTFGWHHDRAANQGYPIKQWEQFKKRGPVTWNTPGGLVTWE